MGELVLLIWAVGSTVVNLILALVLQRMILDPRYPGQEEVRRDYDKAPLD